MRRGKEDAGMPETRVRGMWAEDRVAVAALAGEARERGWWRVSLVVSEREAGRLRDEISPGVDGVPMTIVTDEALHPNR